MEGVKPKRVELKCRDMPMDYDESEFNIHNVELAEEGSSTISPVLRPYDYEDGGNLSFDSLVENDVFLGITGQEDNQWIEEYSHGTNLSVVESRLDNAWSELTSSESDEMLLKSVGQGVLVTESSDEPGCIVTNMDPNLKEDDENLHAQEETVTNKEEEEGVLVTEDLDASDEPGGLFMDMDPVFLQDDENNHVQEAIVTNKEEEGVLENEEDVSVEHDSLTINMDPVLNQDVENNQAEETIVTNEEEEEALVTEELDVSVEHGSLSVNMKQDDENNQAEEAMISNKEEEIAFATEELDVSDEPGRLTINVDPNLKQDDVNNYAQESMVTNEEVGVLVTEELDVSDDLGKLTSNTDLDFKQVDVNQYAHEAVITNKEEERVFATEELDVSVEPDSLTSNMDLDLKQDDGNNYAHEAMLTNTVTEEEMVFATEELGVSDEPDSLTINRDPNLNEDDGNSYAHEAMISNNEEEGAFTTEELDVSDESDNLTTNADPDLKQDDGINYAHETMTTNHEEEVWFATEELDVIDEPEPDSLTVNVDPNLKEDDANNLAQEAMVTNEQVGPLVTEELDVSEDSGDLTTNMDPILKQDDGNNVAIIINKTEDHFSGCNASFDCQKVVVTVTEHSQEMANVSGVELDSEVLANKLEEREEEAFTNEDIDACDEPGSLALNMEPNLMQDDENNHAHKEVIVNKPQDHSSGSDASLNCQKDDVTINEDSQGLVKVSVIELDSNSLVNKCDLREEKVDGICDDVNHEARNIAVELTENKLQEDLSTSKIVDGICDDVNLDAECSTENTDNPIDSYTGIETCTNSDENPLNVESLDKTPFEVEESMPDGSCNLLMTDAEVSHDSKCAITAFPEAHERNTDLLVEDDDKTKSENLAFLESNACSPTKVSDVQSSYAGESENLDGVTDTSETDEGSKIINVDTNITDTCSENPDLVTTPNADSGSLNENDQSLASKLSEQQVDDDMQPSEKDDGARINHDVTFHEEGNTKLPLDMDLDSQKNVESDITILGEPDRDSNSGIVATDYVDAESSIIHGEMISVPCDNEKKGEGYAGHSGTFENESIKVASSMVDCSSLTAAETGANSDSVLEAVHETSVENKNAIMNEQAQEAIDPIPCDSSEKVSDNVEAGDAIKESIPGHHVSTDVMLTSECGDSHTRHMEDGSVSKDKLQSDSSLLNTINNTEVSQSTEVKASKGASNESTSFPKETEDVQRKEQSVFLHSDLKVDKSITFEVSTTVGLETTGKALQLFPASQACNLSMNMEVPCIESSSSTLDPTLRISNEATVVVTPQTPASGPTILAGSQERKRRRKSVGKESVKKGKETTPIQSRRGKKSSPLLVTPPPPTTSAAATDHVIQFQDLTKVESSVTKPTAISNLPDLNNAAYIFHQPFTNNQQVQLRAQILVYGSLISGVPPEEPHMIAAFGQSDASRKTWEAAWHTCVERVHSQKSKVNTPATPQPRSDLKDVGHRSSTPSALSPLIPVSSPLWNMSTPSYVGFQSRSPAFQQSFTPLHPSTYQTPPNPLWLSQSHHPFLGQWGVASSPALSTHRFSGLPITESVTLTPVGPHAFSMPVVDGIVLSSGDSKSRKRKKVTASVSTVSSQVMMTPPVAHPNNCIPFLVEKQTDSVTAPVVTSVFSTPVTVSTPPGRFLSVHDHLRLGDKTVGNAQDLLKRVGEGNVQEADVNATRTCQSVDSRSLKRTKVTTSPAVSYLPQVVGSEISLLTQNHTISTPAPVFSTMFPTSIVMSTPVASTSDSSPTGRFPAVEETLSKVKESTLQAEKAALVAAAEVANCHDVWNRFDSQNTSRVFSDAEAKFMSSITAAAAVAKMASAAAKIASNIAEQSKLMADEVFLSNKSEDSNHISHPFVFNKATPASSLKSVDKTTDNHPNSIISAAREAARRRIEAASAASKHAENLDAIVKAAELASEAVSQVGKIVAISDPSALKKLIEIGPEGFWKVSQLAYVQNQNGGEVSGLHLNSNKSPVNLANNQIMMAIVDSSVTRNEKDTSTSKVSDLSKAVGVFESFRNSPRVVPTFWEEHNIKEGCLVEIYKEDGKYKGAWLAANVLSLKDEKALVCYTGIRSSDGEKVKEWVSFEVEDGGAIPRIRIAHPMTTTMQFEGARKRRRTAVTDYSWSKGDRVDVWMQDCWREGVVMESNKNDATSLTVQFTASAQGETLVVQSSLVRPTLIWKDRKWTEWNGKYASQGDTPKEKRMKLGSPAAAADVIDKRKEKLPMIVESGRPEEEKTLLPLLSADESRFNFGRTTNKQNSSSNLRTMKERAGVVFGVPKPGKKQKFMDVSTQYIDNRTNKNNGLFKFSKPPEARVTENQVTENKPRLKSRKPPVPVFRTMTHVDPVENSSSRLNQTQVGSSSSNKSRDPAKGLASKKGFTFTSKSEPLNRGKLQLPPKTEVDKSNSQVNEPRRSNRKIQPTSRLLEGIQSSITISKIPSVSHAGQRKVMPKGNTNHG